MSFCIEKTLMYLVLKIYLFPVLHFLIKCLITKLRTNRNVQQVLFLYVNFIEKWTGMKNTGLKMPEKDINLCQRRNFIPLQS